MSTSTFLSLHFILLACLDYTRQNFINQHQGSGIGVQYVCAAHCTEMRVSSLSKV